MKWYAVFVQSGKEESVKTRIVQEINDEKIVCCIPKRMVPEKKNGEIVEVVRVIFPGYVFVQVNMNAFIYYKIKSIPYTLNVLTYRNKRDIVSSPNTKEIDFKCIPDEEMQVILRLMNKKDLIGFSKILVIDTRIRVISGPLKGLEGIVKKIDKRKRRAKISLDFFGRENLLDLGVDIIIPTSEKNNNSLTFNGGSNMLEIKRKVEDLINEVLELPKGNFLDNEISNIGINSLAYVKLIVNLESTFEIEIPDEYLVMEAFSTIDEIVVFVEGIL